MRVLSVAVFSLCMTGTVAAQQQPSADEQLAAACARYEAKWDAYVKVMQKARDEGRVEKGGELPQEVAALQRDADAERDAVFAAFGGRDDLQAASYRLLARLYERARDYRAAVGAYERSLAKAPPGTTDLGTMSALCIAAMNSKDDALAATWMRRTIAAEDRAGGARNVQIRSSYYPRTLIALGEWEALGALLAGLAADDAPACRTAAITFAVVADVHRGDLAAAKEKVATIRADAARHPDHQSWAMLAELALRVHDGEFDAAAAAVRAFLAAPPPATESAIDRNWRRYLAAVAPFLGEPAPALRIDHWVGGEVPGDEPLAALRGKVVVLDFWQPWCEPCRKAMPEMVRAQDDHGATLQVLGLCRIENYGYDVSERRAVRPLLPAEYPAHVADFRADMQLNYPLGICATAANNEAYRIAGVPTLVIVDRRGIVRYMSCGAGEPGLFRIALQGVLAAE